MPIQFITPSIISSVANTQVTGTITASQIATVNANTITSGSIPLAQIPQLSGAKLPTGSVLQVVQTVKTDTFSSSSSSFTNITGLTATITPSSTSSRILVMASVAVADASGYFIMLRLARGGSAILQGDAAGSRIRTGGMVYNNPGATNEQHTWSQQVVDSPASTSSLTYSVQTMQEGGATHYVNRLMRDDNATYEPRSASSIILMEIAG